MQSYEVVFTSIYCTAKMCWLPALSFYALVAFFGVGRKNVSGNTNGAGGGRRNWLRI
jgi:hypothetical protein